MSSDHWAEVYRRLSPDPTFPPHRYETHIAGYLLSRNYRFNVIRSILRYIERHGSVEGYVGNFAGTLGDEDRRQVESLIPEQPMGNWLRPQLGGVWTLTDHQGGKD